MPSSVPVERRVWLVAILLAVVFGAGAGLLGFVAIVMPSLRRLEARIDQVANKDDSPTPPATPPIEIIPVEPTADGRLGLPAALRVGRATPTVPVFRLDPRASSARIPASERVAVAVAVTNDGWLVTLDSAFASLPRLAEVGIGWKGKVLVPTKGIRDRATGLLFLKVEARDFPAAALVSPADVDLGQAVWGERASNQYVPTVLTGLGSMATSSASFSSDQWNRRFLLDDVKFPVATPVWEARGQLVGLTLPTSDGATVLPAQAIRSALASVLSGGDIRRPTLGVRYLELGDTFTRQTGTAPTKGALLVGARSVAAVNAQGPAATALREGDIIERIDQDVLDGSWTLAERVLEYRPGTAVTIAGLRQGKPFEARVTFGNAVTSEPLK